jgi:hypothetical protein
MKKSLQYLLLTIVVLMVVSCAPPMAGAPSFALVSEKTEKMRSYYTPIGGEIKDKDCLIIGPLYAIGFGQRPNHEALLAKMLAENKADVLLDATFKTSTFWIPYILLNNCLSIAGTPARLKK